MDAGIEFNQKGQMVSLCSPSRNILTGVPAQKMVPNSVTHYDYYPLFVIHTNNRTVINWIIKNGGEWYDRSRYYQLFRFDTFDRRQLITDKLMTVCEQGRDGIVFKPGDIDLSLQFFDWRGAINDILEEQERPEYVKIQP